MEIETKNLPQKSDGIKTLLEAKVKQTEDMPLIPVATGAVPEAMHPLPSGSLPRI